MGGRFRGLCPFHNEKTPSLYVDGVKQSPDSVPGNFGNWDLTYGIAVGNEPSLDRPWLGTVYLLAVYCKELSQAEITQNFTDGY